MPVEAVSIGKPFFGLRLVTGEDKFALRERCIVLNVGQRPILIEEQILPPLCSVILQRTDLREVEACILIDGFDTHSDEAELLACVRQVWPSAFEVRQEERLRGVEHYMSPKVWLGQIGLTLYHSASVPLNVGLHKDHPFCPAPGFREVHTQIVGIGKMQQCRERSLDTLYLEEVMAPGMTHSPMFDEAGNYPWHQYETITPSIFLAVEMLPDGVPVPE